MENQSNDPLESSPPTEHTSPILGYRAVSDDDHESGAGDVICGSIAILIGIGALALVFFAAGVVIRGNVDSDKTWVAVIIVLLLIFATASAVRSAIFYLGGWSRALARKGKPWFPWNWRRQ